MAKTVPTSVSTSAATAESLRVRPRFLLFQKPQRLVRRKIEKNPYYLVKRILDFLIAAVSFILLSPLLLVVALAIKVDSPGPVIFRQARTGKGGKVFYIYKFRTMVKENNVYDSSRQNQYTRVGKFIRSTSIDELPQLFNVLRGEMSFVGPRPWLPEYYDCMNTRQRGRAKVLPGITGLAQIKGRNDISIFKKINYDLEYVRKFSFHQDAKIFFSTIKTVFVRDGATADKSTIDDELAALKSKNRPSGARG